MRKYFRKPIKVHFLAVVLANIIAQFIFYAPDIPMLKPHSKVLEGISTALVPAMLGLALLVVIIQLLKNRHDKGEQKRGSIFYEFSMAFSTIFAAIYIAKFFEFKEMVVILIVILVVTLVAKLILNLIDKLDELWKKICYEACCLGSYITIGVSAMYAVVSPRFIQLPEFQPEWCVYFIVFFSIIGFIIVRYKYAYEE